METVADRQLELQTKTLFNLARRRRQASDTK